MSSERQFFSGDSLAQALNQAAQHFNMLPAEIDYKLVDKRHGFLKVRRKVVIEVDAANPGGSGSREPSPPADEPSTGADRVAAQLPLAAEPAPEAEPTRKPHPGPDAEPAGRSAPRPMLEDDMLDDDLGGEASAEPAPAGVIELPESPSPATARLPEARGEEAGAAADALGRILDLAGLDLESEILQGEEELQVELWGADQDILLRDRGRLLLAVQHLMPRVIRGLIGRSVTCKVDSDDFHMIREEQLRDMAQRAADEVRHRGRPKTLEPMSPDERRIVHLTLADYPGVETESHGSGLFKRVMVRASRGGGPRDRDSYGKR